MKKYTSINELVKTINKQHLFIYSSHIFFKLLKAFSLATLIFLLSLSFFKNHEFIHLFCSIISFFIIYLTIDKKKISKITTDDFLIYLELNYSRRFLISNIKSDQNGDLWSFLLWVHQLKLFTLSSSISYKYF